jgi:hypothetical protein
LGAVVGRQDRVVVEEATLAVSLNFIKRVVSRVKRLISELLSDCESVVTSGTCRL